MNPSDNHKDRIGRLSPAKQAWLEKRLRGEASGYDPSSSIPRRSDQSTFPLSFAQERLWFLDQLEPGSPIHNRPFALRLFGPLDIRIVEQTLREINRRHQILRATFTNRDGRPVQRILPVEPVLVALHDLSELPPSERESGVKKLAAKEAKRPFDLARGPIWQASVFRLEEEDHDLLLVIHHISYDPWSHKEFKREFTP